ncbi:MAG: hypothetical protein LBU87_01945 [Lactobacillales bacterium]|jgi:hypothetical protein|nr:hypothetical protein [Lactobacillales bacterium]
MKQKNNTAVKESIEKQARENLGLSARRLDKFVRESVALKENLKLRKQQQLEKEEKTCTLSK